jgi:hypothetical protein
MVSVDDTRIDSTNDCIASSLDQMLIIAEPPASAAVFRFRTGVGGSEVTSAAVAEQCHGEETRSFLDLGLGVLTFRIFNMAGI